MQWVVRCAIWLAQFSVLAQTDSSSVTGTIGGIVGGAVGGFGFAALVAWHLLTKTFPKKDEEHATTIKEITSANATVLQSTVEAFSQELRAERDSRQKDRELRHEDASKMIGAFMENSHILRDVKQTLEEIKPIIASHREQRSGPSHS